MENNKFTKVTSNGKYNLVNKYGNYVLEKWVDYIEESWHYALYIIKYNGYYTVISGIGRFVIKPPSPMWFDRIDLDEDEPYFDCFKDSIWYKIDIHGNLIHMEYTDSPDGKIPDCRISDSNKDIMPEMVLEILEK